MSIKYAVIIISVVSLGLASVGFSKTTIIQDGLIVDSNIYDGTESTWLNSSEANTSYGTNGICRVGYQDNGSKVFRSLIRFGQLSHWVGVDTGIAPEAITSIKLVLTTDSGFSGSGICELRLIDTADEEWTEMYCTWNKKRTDVGPYDWAGGPGLGAVYGSVIDTVTWSDGAPANTEMEFELTGDALEAVKDWITGDNTSKGLLLKAETESGSGNNYLDFYSEQTSAGTSLKPKLIITHMPVETIQIYDGGTLPDSNTYDGTTSLWINSGNPDWTGGGTNALMRIGYQGTAVQRALIRYYLVNKDLGFTANDIISARLIVMTDTEFEGSGDCEIRVLNESDEEWFELQTSWNRRSTTEPADWADGYGTGIGTNFGPVIDTISWVNGAPTSTELAFNLTGDALAVVKNWVNGDDTTDSFVLKAAAESGAGNAYFDMYSEDRGYSHPILEITYVITDTIDIQDGLTVAGQIYDGTESTMVWEDWPNTNYGHNGVMRVGYQDDFGALWKRRSLIRFGQLSQYAGIDLGIDVNTIIAAEMVLTADSGFVGDDDVELHIIDTNDENWFETYCTWNKKRVNFPGEDDLNWEGGVGLENSFGPVMDTEWVKTAHADQQKIFEIEGAALDVVKSWITGDNTDASFLLKASNETGPAGSNNYLDFYSEQTSAGNDKKPLLRLYFYDSIGSCYDLRQAGLMMKADLNEDCKVDIEDLRELALVWLGTY